MKRVIPELILDDYGDPLEFTYKCKRCNGEKKKHTCTPEWRSEVKEKAKELDITEDEVRGDVVFEELHDELREELYEFYKNPLWKPEDTPLLRKTGLLDQIRALKRGTTTP